MYSLDDLEKTQLYQISMAWQTPIFTSLLYVLIVSTWSRYNKNNPTTAAIPLSQTAVFRGSVILHNFLLCIFSAVTWCYVIPELFYKVWFIDDSYVLYDVITEWNRDVLGPWTWLFYVSKYYELIDTFILLLKGKPSSFLQTFHHTGAIIGMWTLSSSRTPISWIFVGFNSFIHTWMYLYYMLTGFGYYSPLKKYLTNLQITQFVVGNPIGAYFLFCGKLVDRAVPSDSFGKILGVSNVPSQRIAVAGNFLYVTALIFLFFDFRKRTYSTDKKPRSEEKKKEE